ncbi:MAG: hypothetical protein KKD33_01225 [Verrucomicrobia bacterium]|nr:hypothetical protein [Verrucomicrobiota bacterium]MBU4273819.1 hypothetical protein [Planctomycetota bacterium]
MICKLTGKFGPGVKAHIIPEAFYLIKPDQAHLLLLTNTPGRFSKRSPIGVYDETIVTADGEAIFGLWDNYAADLLLNHLADAQQLTHLDSRVVGYRFASYDYRKLKLFFLSVLWRAGASSHEFFRRVKLGAHLDVLKNHLLAADPGTPDDYAVTLALFDDDPEWAKIIDPFPERYGENRIWFYRLYVGNFIAYVKVDKRVADSPMRDLQFTPDNPLNIVRRNFTESKDRSVMKNILLKNE